MFFIDALTGVITAASNFTKATADTLYLKLTGGTLTGNLTVPKVITGVIYPSADSTTAVQINKADGTTNVVNIDTTNGRVGIGTTSPGNKLSVSGTGSSGVATLGVTTTDDDATLWGSDYLASNLTTGHRYIQLIGQAHSTNNAGYYGFKYSSAGSSSNALTFGLWGADDLMVVQANGNVGIGTTSPGMILDIGTAGVGSSAMGIRLNTDSSNIGPRLLRFARSGTTRFDFGYDGSLDTYFVSNGTYILTGTDTSGRTGYKSNAVTHAAPDATKTVYYDSYLNTVDPLELRANGTPILTAKYSGNVGIGTTSPSAYLNIKAGTATASTAPIKLTAGVNLTTPELGAIEFTDDGTTGHLYVTLNQAGVLTRVQII